MVMWYPRHKKTYPSLYPLPVQPIMGSMNIYKQCINHPQIGVLPLIYHIFHQVPSGFPSHSNMEGRVGKVAEAAEGVASVLWWASGLKIGDGCYMFLPLIFGWNLYHPNFVGYDYCHVVRFITSDCFDVISYDVWLFYTILIYVSLFILLYVIAFYFVCCLGLIILQHGILHCILMICYDSYA